MRQGGGSRFPSGCLSACENARLSQVRVGNEMTWDLAQWSRLRPGLWDPLSVPCDLGSDCPRWASVFSPGHQGEGERTF